jgi:hypothetical protein
LGSFLSFFSDSAYSFAFVRIALSSATIPILVVGTAFCSERNLFGCSPTAALMQAVLSTKLPLVLYTLPWPGMIVILSTEDPNDMYEPGKIPTQVTPAKSASLNAGSNRSTASETFKCGVTGSLTSKP